ncbi:MAG: hypothetical protein R6W31_04545 [Bacteroidales bacterium]
MPVEAQFKSMNVVSRMTAVNPSVSPVIFIASIEESRLMILDIFLRVNMFLLRFNNNFYGAFRAVIDFATGACKTVSAGLVNLVPFEGSTTFVAQNDPDQFTHSMTIPFQICN